MTSVAARLRAPRRRLGLGALTVVVAAMLAGCHPGPVSMAEPRATPNPKDYRAIQKHWTRHGHVTEDFDEALTVDATLQGPEMRAAYIEKWISVYKLGPDEAARARAQLTAEVADVWEVNLQSSSHTIDLDNFSPAKKLWRISLLDDRGRSVSPTEIKLVRDRIEVIDAFFPFPGQKTYVGTFTRSWRLHFPKQHVDGQPLIGPETKRVILRIAGPQGSTDLVWELAR
jgi:hypothetical protein